MTSADQSRRRRQMDSVAPLVPRSRRGLPFAELVQNPTMVLLSQHPNSVGAPPMLDLFRTCRCGLQPWWLPLLPVRCLCGVGDARRCSGAQAEDQGVTRRWPSCLVTWPQISAAQSTRSRASGCPASASGLLLLVALALAGDRHDRSVRVTSAHAKPAPGPTAN